MSMLFGKQRGVKTDTLRFVLHLLVTLAARRGLHRECVRTPWPMTYGKKLKTIDLNASVGEMTAQDIVAFFDNAMEHRGVAKNNDVEELELGIDKIDRQATLWQNVAEVEAKARNKVHSGGSQGQVVWSKPSPSSSGLSAPRDFNDTTASKKSC